MRFATSIGISKRFPSAFIVMTNFDLFSFRIANAPDPPSTMAARSASRPEAPSPSSSPDQYLVDFAT